MRPPRGFGLARRAARRTIASMNLEPALYWKGLKEAAEAELQALLPPETERPQRLHRAMRASVFAGGKRIRPLLCLACGGAVGGPPEAARRPAAALELFHTYTLIHDDLPAMDDDDLRRGRPSCHRAFDEATAILAGDALQALAFEALASADAARCDPARLVAVLARAAGSRGVCAGQAEDLAAEGATPSIDAVDFIHRHKTADLIEAACRIGALAGGGAEETVRAFAAFGRDLGLAYQIVDDILDETQTTETLGKPAGSDAKKQKLTYVRAAGLDRARREADRLRQSAARALSGAVGADSPLLTLPASLSERLH
jgi:geranylgeranyl pyrophosphate synthase